MLGRADTFVCLAAFESYVFKSLKEPKTPKVSVRTVPVCVNVLDFWMDRGLSVSAFVRRCLNLAYWVRSFTIDARDE
ncbi:hypothetical protein ZHAS_00014670 [Anopheles sinensis]|uniref:Uncharacterized protein n=1 Tax=Anopheles sinensis TaxID=74873 RepID=A0A084W8S9_ANOSI|nr:hypothetical protein ZHAS_00014670 [Anopheles sinensis]